MQALDSLNQNLDKVITAAITIAIVVVLGKNMTNSPKLMVRGHHCHSCCSSINLWVVTALRLLSLALFWDYLVAARSLCLFSVWINYSCTKQTIRWLR